MSEPTIGDGALVLRPGGKEWERDWVVKDLRDYKVTVVNSRGATLVLPCNSDSIRFMPPLGVTLKKALDDAGLTKYGNLVPIRTDTATDRYELFCTKCGSEVSEMRAEYTNARFRMTKSGEFEAGKSHLTDCDVSLACDCDGSDYPEPESTLTWH